jgi:hypothetical protein
LKKAKPCCIFHHGERNDTEQRIDADELFDNRDIFPLAKNLGSVLEERGDFEQRMRDVIAFGGVVVGHVYFDTGDSPVESDRSKILAYMESVVDVREEFGYFTRFEDHGCHGSVFYFILRKMPQSIDATFQIRAFSDPTRALPRESCANDASK